MYNIQVHPRMKQLVKLFHQSHVWQNEEEETTLVRNIAPKLFYLILQVFFDAIFILSALITDDKSESVFLFDLGVVASVEGLKLFYILWKKKEIYSLIQVMGNHSVSDSKEFKKINDKVNNLMKFAYSLFLAAFLSGEALIIFSFPLFSNERRLPLNIWFPLDWKNNVVSYCTPYALLIIYVMICTIAISVNGIIWYLMLNCVIKYQILGNQFRNMFETKQTNKKRKNPKVEEENLFLQDFIGLIKVHKNIEETLDRFKACFANLFLVQITTSAICICGSVYALAFGAIDATLIDCVFYGVALSYSLFDIFMMMYFGNEIKLSSDRLSYCLFESNWLERSESCKKCMIIFTEVLKQPQELVIGIFYPLNLETFTSIINLAYSMFNILQNLN